jgi:hypothetical protein
MKPIINGIVVDYYSDIRLERLRRTTKRLSVGSRQIGRNSNRVITRIGVQV